MGGVGDQAKPGDRATARSLGFSNVPAEKRAVAVAIAQFVERGGFLFAMCTATETLDLALAADGVDIAASYADGTPMAPDASARMRWDHALAFQNATLELSPTVPVYSDIDGHQVNSIERRQPLGSFTLFNFSAKIDPVATMLVQNHRQVIPDFYGLTTRFTRQTLKPSVTVLADEPGAPWVKYIHGEHGPGDLDLLRRPRSGGPAAPDRRRADRPLPAPPFAGVPAHPEQRALSRRQEERAQDVSETHRPRAIRRPSSPARSRAAGGREVSSWPRWTGTASITGARAVARGTVGHGAGPAGRGQPG